MTPHPSPRREFLLTHVPGGFVNLRCRGCDDVTRFVRGDDRAVRAFKAAHVCTPADPSDTFTCPDCQQTAPTIFGPLLAAWRGEHVCVGVA